MPTEPISSQAQQSAAARRAIIVANIYAKNTGKMPPAPTTQIGSLQITTARLRDPVIAQSRLPAPRLRPVPIDDEQEEDETHGQKSHLIKGLIFIVLGIMLYLILANASRPATPTHKVQSATPAHQTTVPTKIVRPVVRIGQANPSQYASTQEYNTWWGSACSPTSMTEVFNAYGRNYRITDVLKVEAGLQNPQEITSDQGLLNNSAIDRTASYFGFQTIWLHDSLDGIIQKANAGNPVIVNFPPYTWTGGHFLLVTGGNATQVDLADSSKINMQVMSRETFLKYWVGLAALVTPKVQVSTPSGSYSVIGGPTLSVDFMNQVLTAYHSPAAGKAQSLYNLGVKYGIDPAFALAFFLHESTFGTRGEANSSLSLGNLRCIPNAQCRDGYAWFTTWEDGFEAWDVQIRAYINGDINKAIGRNACPCTTVPQIIPVYAPTSDNNDESLYIKTVETAIDTWHSGKVWVPQVG